MSKATQELRALQEKAAQTRERRRDEQRRWRAGLAARGLVQVQGIYAPPDLHSAIKVAAARITSAAAQIEAQ